MKPRYSLFLLFMMLVACIPATAEPSALPTEITQTIKTPASPVTVASTNADVLSDCPLTSQDETGGTLRLIYVIEGNLWLADEGKEPVQMIDNGDVEQVMLSPDGSRVVVTRRRDANTVEVWVADSLGWRELSGEEGISGSVEFISLSDDGQLVAFYRLINPDRELWVANVNAGVRQLVSREDLRAREGGAFAFSAYPYLVTWIPGTHQLTYVPVLEGQGGDFVPNPEPVLRMDADSGEQNVLFPVDQGGYITYSPDGKIMIITDNSRVRILRVNNLNEPQIIMSYTSICGIPDCYIPEPAWRPDSSSFLLTLPSEGMNPDNFLNGFEEPFMIWEFSADGAIVRTLSEFFRIARPFSFSPDLKRAAYYRRENTLNLHIANVDGSEDILYDSDQDWDFYGWASDSRHFAYKAHQDAPIMYGDICGDATLLTDLANVEFVGWLGTTRFLMHVGTSTGWNLHLGTAGGNSSRLVEFGASVIYDYVLMPK